MSSTSGLHREMSSTSGLHSDLHLRPPYTKESRKAFTQKCIPLYKAALTGDWEAAQKVIEEDETVVHASITEGGETALHIAAAGKNLDFVQKLILEMDNLEKRNNVGKILEMDNNLEKRNNVGNTALCFAAAEGNLQIVQLLIDGRHWSPSSNGVKPIYMAASLGHNDIVERLYPCLDDFNKNYTREEKANILTACTASGLFDVALKMITQDNELLTIPDDNAETTLDVLVHMSSEFTDDNKKPTCFGSAKELLKYILELALDFEKEIDMSNLMPKFPKLVMVAAMLGNIEFLVIFLQHFPHLIWTTDTLNRSIFHHAVSIRHRGIFNLIYEVNSIRSFLTNKRDQDDNNMLHLVANLAPQNELDKVSGAALQMQCELLWFKEVSKIVPPSYRNMKNKAGQTPADIFTEKHEKLMKNGEKWMKGTATASMLVATIIASVVFTAIFTVPGGIDNKTGVPIMSHKPIMKVFYMSMVMALFSSSTSILMFLSILTSRYAEKDFLHSLPLKLMLGVTTLILSLGAMVLAFCTTIFLSYNGRFSLFHILLGLLFSLVPILCFLLKFYLLRDVICSAFNAHNMFGPQNRLFSQKR